MQSEIIEVAEWALRFLRFMYSLSIYAGAVWLVVDAFESVWVGLGFALAVAFYGLLNFIEGSR